VILIYRIKKIFSPEDSLTESILYGTLFRAMIEIIRNSGWDIHFTHTEKTDPIPQSSIFQRIFNTPGRKIDY
jgi:hypothetical protein